MVVCFSFFWTICCTKSGRANKAIEAVFAIGNCDSCIRPISTHPGSVEAGVYGLTRGMSFVARHFDVVEVAGLLWISWFVLGGVDFLLFMFFSIYLVRTHTAYNKYEASLSIAVRTVVAIAGDLCRLRRRKWRHCGRRNQ